MKGGEYLIVDDDEPFRGRLARALRKRGLIVHEAGDPVSARSAMRELRPSYVVLDLKMPGASGVDLISQLREERADVRIVMLTGFGSIATTVDALRAGAINYLTKPVDVERVLAAFRDQRSPQSTVGYETPSLASVEWNHIQRVLQESGGNITRAAKVLGVHRRSLQRKLAKAAQ